VNLQPPFYPIVFLRGFAMSDSNIFEATNQVYQGFEVGSTRRRQDTGPTKTPVFFESAVVRLMKDHGYDDSFRDNGYGFDSAQPASARSLWVHRYYDQDDADFGDGQRHPMEIYAIGLRRTVLKIRDKLVRDGAVSPDEFKIHLVAHSMGGLVARCYLQNICIHGTGDAAQDAALELPATTPEDHYVARFFTYATPHNGIEFHGLNVPDFGPVNLNQVGVFNRGEMRKFLKADPATAVNDISSAFDKDRVFCLIGTDYRDYDVDISKWATGGPGDGLVMCANAYTAGSPRAFVRRAHGGPYGIVNSEEGYQNLRRFLFGDWRVDVQVVLDEVQLPDAVAQQLRPGDTVSGDYLLDVIASVRGGDVLLQERRVSTESAITFSQTYSTPDDKNPALILDDAADRQSQVASLFLLSSTSAETLGDAPGPMLFALRLALETPSFKLNGGILGGLLQGSLPGFKAFAESYQIRIDPVAKSVLFAAASTEGQSAPGRELANARGSVGAADGFSGQIFIGPDPSTPLGPGQIRGRIVVTVSVLNGLAQESAGVEIAASAS
jgi:hypothetical protein